MNFADSEIITSVLASDGYTRAAQVEDADVILLNTCAIRDKAEAKIWQQLRQLRSLRQRQVHLRARDQPAVVGVLGCMAERLKGRLLDEDGLLDIVAGPDAYRGLPSLLAEQRSSHLPAMDVALSPHETYADIPPTRSPPHVQPSVFVSIMRRCNNMCAFCVVPYTRGRERSRQAGSVEEEVRRLAEEGYREVTLLGQNVNSYADATSVSQWNHSDARIVAGFSTVYKLSASPAVHFAELLDRLAPSVPSMRIRFTSPHPKDFPDPLLHVMKAHANIGKAIHIPAQSGSSEVLEAMRRGYTREAYLALIEKIRSVLPGVALSSDSISGFCGETEADHQQTLSLLRAEHTQ